VKNPPIKSKKKGVLSWRIHERGVSKSWTEVNHKHNRNPKQPNNFWSTSLNENVINDLIRLKKCRQKIFINSDNYMIITRLISKSSRHAASLSWISSPLLQVVSHSRHLKNTPNFCCRVPWILKGLPRLFDI